MLQGIGHGAAEVLRVSGFALQDDAEGDDRVRFFFEATSRTTTGISKAPGT